jgi:hypothetical protein
MYNRTYRSWKTPAARYRQEQRMKRRAERLHWHVCDYCVNDAKFACTDYHCKNNKKRVCGVCRREKKYHIIYIDVFESVALAARSHALKKKHIAGELIAVHMEAVYSYGEITHKYWAHWSDGSKTEMSQAEITQWAAQP